MVNLTHLATTVTARYFPILDLTESFFLDGRLAGKNEGRSADVTVDKESKGFMFSVFSHTNEPDANQENLDFLEPLNRLTEEVKNNKRPLDAQISNFINSAISITGRLRLQNENLKPPFFAGIMVKDSEAFALTMGRGLAFLYRDDVLFPLTASDVHMEAVNIRKEPVENFYNFCASKTATALYSNIAQLRMDDCIILCNKEVYEALGQQELLRILDAAEDQSDAAAVVMTAAAAKIPGIPMQFMISFVEGIRAEEKSGFFSFGKKSRQKKSEPALDIIDLDSLAKNKEIEATSIEEGIEKNQVVEDVILPVREEGIAAEAVKEVISLGANAAEGVAMAAAMNPVGGSSEAIIAGGAKVAEAVAATEKPNLSADMHLSPSYTPKKDPLLVAEAMEPTNSTPLSKEFNTLPGEESFQPEKNSAISENDDRETRESDVVSDIHSTSPSKAKEEVKSEQSTTGNPTIPIEPLGGNSVAVDKMEPDLELEADFFIQEPSSVLAANPLPAPIFSAADAGSPSSPVEEASSSTAKFVYQPFGGEDKEKQENHVDDRVQGDHFAQNFNQGNFAGQHKKSQPASGSFIIPFESDAPTVSGDFTSPPHSIPDMPIYSAPTYAPPTYPTNSQKPMGNDQGEVFIEGSYNLDNKSGSSFTQNGTYGSQHTPPQMDFNSSGRNFGTNSPYPSSQNRGGFDENWGEVNADLVWPDPSTPFNVQGGSGSFEQKNDFSKTTRFSGGDSFGATGEFESQNDFSGTAQYPFNAPSGGYQHDVPFSKTASHPPLRSMGANDPRYNNYPPRRPKDRHQPMKRPGYKDTEGGKKPVYGSPDPVYDRNKILMVVLGAICLICVIILIYFMLDGGKDKPTATTGPSTPTESVLPSGISITPTPVESQPIPEQSSIFAYFEFSENSGFRSWWDAFNQTYNLQINDANELNTMVAKLKTFNELPADFKPVPGTIMKMPVLTYLQGDAAAPSDPTATSNLETTSAPVVQP